MTWTRKEYLENFGKITGEMLILTTKKSNDYAARFRSVLEISVLFGELGILVRMSGQIGAPENGAV